VRIPHCPRTSPARFSQPWGKHLGSLISLLPDSHVRGPAAATGGASVGIAATVVGIASSFSESKNPGGRAAGVRRVGGPAQRARKHSSLCSWPRGSVAQSLIPASGVRRAQSTKRVRWLVRTHLERRHSRSADRAVHGRKAGAQRHAGGRAQGWGHRKRGSAVDVGSEGRNQDDAYPPQGGERNHASLRALYPLGPASGR
jgi:hypothetical protein